MPHVSSKSVLPSPTFASRCLPRASRRAPRCRNMPQDAPKETHLGPSLAPTCSKIGQRWVRKLPKWPEIATGASRETHFGPNCAPRCPNIGPRWAQEGMMSDLGSPVDHKTAPKTCKMSFKVPSHLVPVVQGGLAAWGVAH